MDAEDPLASFKDRFYHLPRKIYMDGNSLGLISKDAKASLLEVLEEWKSLGVGGWGRIPWIGYAERLGEMQAGMVGAIRGAPQSGNLMNFIKRNA
jgi:kynureninase